MVDTPEQPRMPVCRICGERVVRSHRGTGHSHVSRLVAACELDGDHVADLDTVALGEVPCAGCAGAVVDRGAGWEHVAPGPAGHEPSPVHPLI
ncbi:MAG: hypothetical protein RIB67_08665 [Miltoncostaeaceae bacterium]